MKVLTWLVVLGAIGVTGYLLWTWRQRWLDHKRASEERLAAFMAQARPAAPSPEKNADSLPETRVAPPPEKRVDPSLPQQRLLFEAAAKAGEAGEPVLSIQLYARLIARFPDSAFAAQARGAVEVQKQKLAKA
jgi:hypothetical protein